VIRLEDVGFEGPGEERVVHAEEQIGQRRVFGQDGFVEDCPSIPALQQDNFSIVGFFKGFKDLFTDTERIMCHHDQPLRSGGLGGSRLRCASRQKQEKHGKQESWFFHGNLLI
jgi:hypothetical protein